MYTSTYTYTCIYIYLATGDGVAGELPEGVELEVFSTVGPFSTSKNIHKYINIYRFVDAYLCIYYSYLHVWLIYVHSHNRKYI
jgi:hypothetical protein